MSAVEELLQGDDWSVAEVVHASGPAVIRFRTPVPDPETVGDHTRLLTIVWG